MAATTIEWTEASWNPATGCSKISPGCKHCYAERMARRLKAMGNTNYRNGFAVTLQPQMLEAPLKWKSPRKIFVNSMSDLFHEAIPFSFIEKVFAIMNKAAWHTFQILTKRADRLLQFAPHLPWSCNIWMGVTVEHASLAHRIGCLAQTSAQIKFLSCEPLLGSLAGVDMSAMDWVIAGGESGPGARPMREQWALEIRDQCLARSIPFFFKQWGGVNKKKNGRVLDGRIWDEWPVVNCA